jgi:hypothetical protein
MNAANRELPGSNSPKKAEVSSGKNGTALSDVYFSRMDQQKALALLLRSITDILARSESLLRETDPDEATMGNFIRYTEEVKKFMLEKIKNREVLDYADSMPTFRFTLDQLNIFQYYLMMRSGEKQAQMTEALERIAILRGRYASLEFVVKDILGRP